MDPPAQIQRTGSAGREPVQIGSVLRPFEYYLKGGRQNLLAVQDALQAVLPQEMIGLVRAEGVHGGILTLSVPDAAGKCLLEAVLRGGAFEALRGALPDMALRKATVVLA